MVYRVTELRHHTLKERRKLIALAVANAQGNLRKAAFTLGISRRLLYYRVGELQLWNVVNEARRARVRKSEIAEQKTALRKGRKLFWVSDA